MRILVAGGTGFLGSEITAAALDAGHAVTVLSRHASPARADPRAAIARGDVLEPAGLPAAIAGHDAVVDAVQFPNSPVEDPKKGLTFERVDLGGTRNLVDAAKQAGAGLFVGLSGVGAGEHAEYHWLRFKWQEEQYIAASGLPHVIFRPSWVYGAGDVALNRFLGFARYLPFVPVIGDGRTRINPLFVRDLAAHVVAALDCEPARGHVFEIGGPNVLTMDEIIRTALDVSGRRRFLLHSPKPLMKLAASVLQYLPGRPLTPGAVDFITQEGIADNAALGATFALPLTPLREGLRTYLASRQQVHEMP